MSPTGGDRERAATPASRGGGLLWPDERLEVHEGTEVLTWVSVPDRPTAPPVVLLPGVGHLGRIFYGHPGSDPDHFLAHRLVAAGHPVVALSYPLAHPVFSRPRPDLTMAGWSAALASATATALAGHGLARDVVVTAWSGAGGVATRLGPALRAVEVEPVLLVALVASPPMLGLSPQWDEYPLAHRTDEGLVGLDGLAGWFNASLDAVNHRAGREVLSPDRYRTDHQGAFPVALCVTELRHRPGGFVADRAEAAADLASADLRSMPPVAVVRDTDPSDAGHALRDRWAWSPYLAAWLLDRVAGRLPDGDDPAWTDLRHRFDSLSEHLVRTVEGNHLCFLGAGAGPTAEAIDELITEAAALRTEVPEGP